MATLALIGLIILGIVLLIGIIRIIFSPYTGFVNMLMEMMLLDWLFDGMAWVFDSISEIFDGD